MVSDERGEQGWRVPTPRSTGHHPVRRPHDGVAVDEAARLVLRGFILAARKDVRWPNTDRPHRRRAFCAG